MPLGLFGADGDDDEFNESRKEADLKDVPVRRRCETHVPPTQRHAHTTPLLPARSPPRRLRR